MRLNQYAAAILLAATTTGASGQAESVKQLLKDYGSTSTAQNLSSFCDETVHRMLDQSLDQMVAKEVSKKITEFNLGNFAMASTADTTAQKIAHCYLDAEPGELGFAATHVGELLGISVLSQAQSGMGLDVESTKFVNALTLMRYGKQQGGKPQTLAILEQQLPEPSPAAAENAIAADIVNATDLVEQLSDNELRVKRKYHGKPITVRGKVHRVGEYSSGGIYVKLFGKEVWDPEDRPEDGPLSATHIVCQIAPGSADEDRAIDLDKGDEISVSGQFEYETRFAIRTPTVVDCTIN